MYKRIHRLKENTNCSFYNPILDSLFFFSHLCVSAKRINKTAEDSISVRLYGEHGHLKYNEQTEACEDVKKHGQEAGRRIVGGLWSYGNEGNQEFLGMINMSK